MSEKFDFIEFIDSTQINLDSIKSCTYAIHYHAQIHDDKSLRSIANTLEFNVEQLKKSFNEYLTLYRKDDTNDS